MSRSADSRVVFIHVAKTAGTSLTAVLRDALPADSLTVHTHRPLASLPTSDHAATVAVVREPLDRLVSAWSWLQKRPPVWWDGNVAAHDLVAELGLDRYADPIAFLDHFDLFYEDHVRPFAENLAACDRRLGDLMTFGHFNLFVPQNLYLRNGRGELAVGRTLRFTHLQDDTAALLADRGADPLAVKWPHHFASTRRPAAEYATPRALAAVRDIYRADYDLPGMPPAPDAVVPDHPPPPAPSPLHRLVCRVRAASACPVGAVGDAPAIEILTLLQGEKPEVAPEDLPADRRPLAAGSEPGAVLLAWAWEMRALLQDAEGDRQAAIVSLCRAVGAHPEGWPARVRLAGWRWDGGDRRVAAEELRRLKELAEAHPSPEFLAALAALAARLRDG